MKAVKRDGFDIYEGGGPRAEWFWRLCRRGRVVADGSEGYTRRADATRAVLSIARWLKGAVKVTVSDPAVRPGRKR